MSNGTLSTGTATGTETEEETGAETGTEANEGTGTETETGTETGTGAEAAELPKLEALALGALKLTPSFNSETTDYTANTSNNTNKLAFTASEGATVRVTLNGDEVDAGTDGRYTLTWEPGENVAVILLTNSAGSTGYAVTVNKA